MSVGIFEGCGSQRSRRKKTRQSVVCFLPALSFPASLSPVPSTCHSDSKAHLLGLGSAVLGSLAMLEGAGLCGCFHFYSMSPESGTTRDGGTSEAVSTFSLQLVAGSSVGCQGARKAAVKKLPGTVALEAPGHGRRRHGKATRLTGSQWRNFSNPSGVFGQETAGGTGSTQRQFEGDLSLLLYLSVIDGVASFCQCIVARLFCDQSLMSRDLEMCEEVKETRSQGVKNSLERAWKKA